MAIEVTREQLHAADQAPVRVTDPETQREYVLVPAGLYDRLHEIVDDEFDPQEAYPLIDKIMAEDDANDPLLESYQKYRKQP